MNKAIPEGVMPAFLTPFTREGKVNEAAVRELADFHIQSGVCALYVGGSTGEGMIMTTEQRMAVAEAAVGAAAGRVSVIIHVGAADTESAVLLAEHAKKTGADGLSSVPPYYYKMSKSYIREYYSAVSAAGGLPFLAYNIPQLTGVSIGADFMIELMELPNVVGLKYTDTNLEEFRKIKAWGQGKIKGYMGHDAMMLCALTMGADGGIGSFYNIMPRAFANVYRLYGERRIQEACAVMWRINDYIAIIKKYICPANQPALKAILRKMGIDCGPCKGPLMPLSDLAEGDMLAELEQNGFFAFAATGEV